MTIDAHVHFWKYDKWRDAWITDEMKTLQKHFLPRQLKDLLLQNKIDGVIAVQVDQNENAVKFYNGN